MTSYEGFLPMAGVHGMFCVQNCSLLNCGVSMFLWELVWTKEVCHIACDSEMMEKIIIATILLNFLTFWDF
jgi:hypothetical protein